MELYTLAMRLSALRGFLEPSLLPPLLAYSLLTSSKVMSSAGTISLNLLFGKGPRKTGTSNVPLFPTKDLQTKGESFKDKVNGQTDEYLADPGEARGCSTNTVAIN